MAKLVVTFILHFNLFRYIWKSPSQISPIVLYTYILKNDILIVFKVLPQKSQEINCQLEKTVAKQFHPNVSTFTVHC